MAIYTGIVSSQIRKYAGYAPGGFDVNSARPSLDTSDIKQEDVSANFTSSNKYSKLLFVSETTSQIAATLNTASRAMAGYSNPPVAGYTLGGENNTGSTVYSKIEKLTFAGESNSVLSTTLSTNIFAMSGTNNGSTSGYIFGGYSTTTINTINKMTFSNESNSAITATLPTARHSTVTLSNGPTALYSAGGLANTSAITKLTLSNDTTSTMSAVLTHTSQRQTPSCSNVGTAGYCINRSGANLTYYTANHHKLNYSNETVSYFSSGDQSNTMIWAASFGYANIAGYFMGGMSYNSVNIANATRRVSKFLYSTEVYSGLSQVMLEYKRQTQGFSHTN